MTILSRDGTLADALSKAAFILGPSKGLALAMSPRLHTAFHHLGQ